MYKGVIALAIASLVALAFCEEKTDEGKKAPIVRARLEVKAFLYEDLPHYHDARVKYIPGADPVMHLYDEQGKEVKKIDVADLSRGDISQLLESHGLKKSAEKMKEEEQSEEEEEEEEPLPEDEQEFPDEEDEDLTDEMPEDRSAEKEEL